MTRLTKGVDQEGRIITLLVELNLTFHHLDIVAHLRSTWSEFKRLRRCLIGMNILTKRSVRWLYWRLLIMHCYGGRTWKSREKGWRKEYHHLDDYEKGDEKEVYTWLLQTKVIHKTSDIATRFFKYGRVFDGVELLMIRCELIKPKNKP